MKKLLLLFGSILIAGSLFAQTEVPDTVFLNNGTIVTGTITYRNDNNVFIDVIKKKRKVNEMIPLSSISRVNQTSIPKSAPQTYAELESIPEITERETSEVERFGLLSQTACWFKFTDISRPDGALGYSEHYLVHSDNMRAFGQSLGVFMQFGSGGSFSFKLSPQISYLRVHQNFNFNSWSVSGQSSHKYSQFVTNGWMLNIPMIFQWRIGDEGQVIFGFGPQIGTDIYSNSRGTVVHYSSSMGVENKPVNYDDDQIGMRSTGVIIGAVVSLGYSPAWNNNRLSIEAVCLRNFSSQWEAKPVIRMSALSLQLSYTLVNRNKLPR